MGPDIGVARILLPGLMLPGFKLQLLLPEVREKLGVSPFTKDSDISSSALLYFQRDEAT